MANQSITERIRTQANEIWANYGWILMVANVLFTLGFLYMVLKKRSE